MQPRRLKLKGSVDLMELGWWKRNKTLVNYFDTFSKNHYLFDCSVGHDWLSCSALPCALTLTSSLYMLLACLLVACVKLEIQSSVVIKAIGLH